MKEKTSFHMLPVKGESFGLRDELHFIEVKDFRGYRIQNKKRLTTGELVIEIGQKVRDSVACIVGAGRTSSERRIWQTYTHFLCHGNSRIRVILWLEQDHSRPKEVVKNDVLLKELKRRLKWLGARVSVYSLPQSPVDLDLRVISLPQERH